MKKTVLAGIGLVSLLMLGACGGGNDADSNDSTKTVGVLQLVQHASLDNAYDGFKEGLEEGGYKEGENLKIEYQNAQNNQDNLKSMSEKLVKEEPDLLLGIATPAAQSLLNATTEIPITVTAVTDLEEAKLVKSDKKPGGNVQEQRTWCLSINKSNCSYQSYLMRNQSESCTTQGKLIQKSKPTLLKKP